MPVLTSQQRSKLEAAVKQARKFAETGAYEALRSLAVDHPEPFVHMDSDQRSLRNILRSKARLLGDELMATGEQKIDHLTYELGYETWHKMLFAKFLEANGLLMHPDGVAVTLEDCEELSREEHFADKWDAAAEYASKMLPAIFRPEDPLMKVRFAPNDRIKLEEIIAALDDVIFVADDALGWVYQFWQSEAKAAINASGDKIDGARLPAVTQLFTEPYMVHFLIDNTLGAWWTSRNPGVKPPVKFEYLRVAPASSRSNVASTSSLSNDSPAGSRSDYTYFDPDEEVEYMSGNLPHWRQEGKIYFVTFRTADSMPQDKLKEWQVELDAWKIRNPEPHSPEQIKEYHQRFPAKMQDYMDAGYGVCQLKNEKIKTVVENALKFFDGERYVLDEFVVAANHVHVLVEPLGENRLSDILHSWKSFTANEINRITGHTGAFWQKESFDHLVRSERSLEKFRMYIRNHNNLRQDGGATLFPGWPDKTAEVTTLDPCMGSGHFIISLFSVMAPLRMVEEGLSRKEATDKVITENLHGLEIDPRCTQIAAFNLALTAWKFCGSYRELPEMNLACSGIAPKGKVEDWVKLVGKAERFEDKQRLENGMRALYDHFQLAPELGSLLDPTTIKADVFTASFEELQPVLKKALESEASVEQVERGVLAAGIAKAGQILANKYTLQITNVPYLSRGKQDQAIANYIENHYKEAKGDLATVFLEKMLKANTLGGIACCVIPQNWLFLTSYTKFREKLLKNETWSVVARLGAKGFQTPMWDFNVMLISIAHSKPTSDHTLAGLDVSDAPHAAAKDEALKTAELKTVNQKEQLGNPDIAITLDVIENKPLLNIYVISIQGLATGDDPRFARLFWEITKVVEPIWKYYQGTSNGPTFSGKQRIVFWEDGNGALATSPQARIQGLESWSNQCIAIKMIGSLTPTPFDNCPFDMNVSAIIPKRIEYLLPVWTYVSSPLYNKDVRKINQKLNVTNATLAKVPFDLDHWQKVSAEKYPDGLPKPYSDDPTQWLFHGHPIKTEDPLQVAVARLLGYRWPTESDTEMELADEAHKLIAEVKAFDAFSDEDGIFCIPSVNAEPAGSDRLRDFLQKVFATDWTNQTVSKLLRKVEAASSGLEEYLRKEFFIQHCKVFQNRPFIWHIWDGRNDGFSALVNYHKLNKDNLSKLIYTYLGDWIRMCEAKRKAGESGAEGLLSAAQKLKEKLELILEGEAPYDIFVRWKSLEQQPIGWDPDLNDGVRLNIRPFMEAGVLRKNPNIKWGIDRGKNPPGTPWGEIRDNDKHLSLAEKRSVREIKT